ncbi:MAG: hypothetical protein M0C28_07880 [Candidatus Moduliflexus flocculans]|nr:hypothetical protein [Candidatus Moduliflexus flocculans]
MAQENGISREDQDALALRSHQRAAAALGRRALRRPGDARRGAAALRRRRGARQPRPRRHHGSRRCAALKPVFDRRYGTITAGNSSPAHRRRRRRCSSCREEKAKALGLRAPAATCAATPTPPSTRPGQLLHGPGLRRAAGPRAAPG